MKLARFLSLAGGVLLLLVAIAAGVARAPSFQHWVVVRVVAKHPELHLQLESVSAGLSSLTLRGVQLEHRGVKVTVAELQADYSLWPYLFDHRVQLGKLAAQGILVDASALSPRRTQAGLAAAPAVAPGALAQLRLPWEIWLDEIDLHGRIVLAGAAGQPALPGEFALQGGRIAPGRDGELRLRTLLRDPAPQAAVTQLEAQTTLLLKESSSRTFDRLNLTSQLTATGPGFTSPNQLKLAAAMSRTASGEIYRVTLDTLRAGQGENLVTLNAALQSDGRSYAGDWAISARTAQLESFLLGRTLPKFFANGSGRFDFSPDKTSGALQGALQVEASEFEKLRPELSAIGLVRLKSDFDLTAGAGEIQIRKFSLGLAAAQPVLDLHTTGVLAYNLKQRRFEPTSPAAGELFRLKLSGLPLAWLAPVCSGVTLSGGALSGEFAVRPGEGNQVTIQTSVPLQAEGVSVIRSGQTLLANTAVKIEAEAGLSPTQAQVTIRSLTLNTAAGDSLRATATLATALDRRSPLEFAGEFSADLPKIQLPPLPAGAVKAKGGFGGKWQDDLLEVIKFAVESTDAQGDSLGAVNVTRAFSYDLARGRADTGTAEEVVLATLKIGQLPLLPLPRIFPDYAVSGRVGPAEATLSAIGGKIILRASQPVAIADFSLAKRRKPILERLGLKFQPVVEFEQGALTRVQSGVVVVQTSADIPLAEWSAELTRNATGWRAVSTYNFDLPAWSSQPVMRASDALSAGQASGELRAVFTGASAQVEARTTFAGLIASEGAHTLPVANVSFRADLDANGHFAVQAPVLLDRAGQRSDLDFTADGTFGRTGVSFQAKLKSEHLELPDLLLLLAVTGSPLAGEGAESAAAQSRALSPPSADAAPFWAGTAGQLTLDCTSVVGGSEWTMSGLSGRVVVDGDSLQLEKLEAAFDGESRFAAKGSITFSEGLDPYLLAGNFSLTEFDLGRFFKAINPDQIPTLEGFCTVNGQLAGQGLNFDDTLDRTRGTFALTSRKGVFRGLKRTTDKVSLVSKAVDLLGVLISDKSAEKIAGGAPYFSDQLAQELGELHFDQFTVTLVRDLALNLKLENITLVTPHLHFIGSGRVTYTAGKSLLEQPLEASLSIRGRGKIEELLGKLKVLDGTRDELGYAKTKENLAVGGTLGRPSVLAYFTGVIAEKLNDALRKSGDGL